MFFLKFNIIQSIGKKTMCAFFGTLCFVLLALFSAFLQRGNKRIMFILPEYKNLLNFTITLKLLFARTKVKNPSYLHKIIQKGRIRTDKKIVDFIKT